MMPYDLIQIALVQDEPVRCLLQIVFTYEYIDRMRGTTVLESAGAAGQWWR
jgi:hypothetical protein